MSNLVIIHFAPLELYPPVQNLIRILEKEPVKKRVVILTTRSFHTKLRTFESTQDHIKIVRCGKSGRIESAFLRYFHYLKFNFLALVWLCRLMPKRILYFETLSSFPAYIYKKFLKKNAGILVHYHEYTSPEEYRTAMKMMDYFHRLEKKMLPLAVWVSHTNEFRMTQFQKDILPVRIPGEKRIVPNYPPSSWFSPPRHKTLSDGPLKIVYAGALSLSSMFTREFAEWVVKQQGRVTWDIYAYNFSGDVISYVDSLQTEWITFKGGVDYESLPLVLQAYDVGVILYKGVIPNHVYSASNKLFEYAVCGLDVWFADTIEGSYQYIITDAFPKILSVDFMTLSHFDFAKAFSRSGISHKMHDFSAESMLKELTSCFYAD